MSGALNDYESPNTSPENTPPTMNTETFPSSQGVHSQFTSAASLNTESAAVAPTINLARPPRVYSQGSRQSTKVLEEIQYPSRIQYDNANRSTRSLQTYSLRSSPSTTINPNSSRTHSLRPTTSTTPNFAPSQTRSLRPSTSTATNLNASNPASKPRKKSTLPPSQPPSSQFELTPLSSLISQSYSDLRTLKRIHTRKVRSNAFGKEDLQKQIDFEKIEQTLKGFEELYNQYLRFGGWYGGEGDEVCLVAMVCKKSEVVQGIMEKGVGTGQGEKEVVPMRKVPDCYM